MREKTVRSMGYIGTIANPQEYLDAAILGFGPIIAADFNFRNDCKARLI